MSEAHIQQVRSPLSLPPSLLHPCMSVGLARVCPSHIHRVVLPSVFLGVSWPRRLQMARMGFGRAEAEAALSQAGNDLHAAINLALNGAVRPHQGGGGDARPVCVCVCVCVCV